jgi:hypothetical protein
MGGRHAGLAPFAPEVLAEYERCAAIAGTAESICEDYRASATIDLVHDREDIAAGRQLAQPLRVLWGEHGAVGKAFDVLALWRDRAADVSGRALPRHSFYLYNTHTQEPTHEHPQNRSHRRRRHRQGNHARGRARA